MPLFYAVTRLMRRRILRISGLLYFEADPVCPSLRKRSCSLPRNVEGVFGLNATRYHKGWLRSFASAVSVAESAFGWRATFSRIAAYGCLASLASGLAVTLGCSLIRRRR